MKGSPHTCMQRSSNRAAHEGIVHVGKVIDQCSTHVAILNGNEIRIYIRSIVIDGNMIAKPEFVRSVPLCLVDSVFATFEQYREDSRIRLSEFLNNK